jgi:ABC-type spermidine/putrescine transport system permease subunit I
MELVLLIGAILVYFAWFGNNSCPKFIRDNKKLITGIVIGLFITKYMNIEGSGTSNGPVVVAMVFGLGILVWVGAELDKRRRNR